jgi:hypothetical protein
VAAMIDELVAQTKSKRAAGPGDAGLNGAPGRPIRFR